MSAYVIFIRESMSDEREFETYTKLALPTLEGRPVTPLAFYGALEIMEGPVFEGAVVLEFPSVKDAQEWYYSPEYQAAAKHRKAGSEYRVFIVEGKK